MGARALQSNHCSQAAGRFDRRRQSILLDIVSVAVKKLRHFSEVRRADDLAHLLGRQFHFSERCECRRIEDERFAYFSEAAIVFLDLPDAVFRGYHDDDQLLGQPVPDDLPPVELLRREILRLEPQRVYFPLAVGGHVDHRLCRAVGLEMLGEDRGWVMPGPDYTGLISFGHAAFFGLGAYTVTIALVKFDITPWLGIPLGTVKTRIDLP